MLFHDAGFKTRNRRCAGGLAHANGLSAEDYLEQLVKNKLPLTLEEATVQRAVVWFGKVGYCLPYWQAAALRVVDDAIRQVHEERAQHIWASILEAVLR